MDVKDLINTFFFLILIMFSNYLYELFPRQLNNFLVNSVIIKHLLIIFLVFFSLELNDRSNSKSPFQKFYESLIVYVFYLFFNKSTLFPSILIITLLASSYIMIKQQEYLKYKGEGYKHLDQAIDIVNWVVLGVMIVSFLLYFNKQLVEQKEFSIGKFIFGSKFNSRSKKSKTK
jgi:hypothetical protein